MNYETMINAVENAVAWVASDTNHLVYSVAGLVVFGAVCVFFRSLSKCGCNGYGNRIH